MPLKEAAEIDNQQPIFERLEAAKRAGVISEYLLKWRGGSGGFTPKVTVWQRTSAANDFIRQQVVKLLRGLVASSQIFVLDDDAVSTKQASLCARPAFRRSPRR